jgi:hypothetical protein
LEVVAAGVEVIILTFQPSRWNWPSPWWTTAVVTTSNINNINRRRFTTVAYGTAITDVGRILGSEWGLILWDLGIEGPATRYAIGLVSGCKPFFH